MGVSAPSCAGRMGVLPSKPRSGDAMIAPHRARQRAKVWGMWNCQFWASERSVNSISTRANLAYCTTSSRPGTYRIQPTPSLVPRSMWGYHCIAASRLFPLDRHTVVHAPTGRNGRFDHSCRVVAPAPPCAGLGNVAPRLASGWTIPLPPLRPPNGGRGIPARAGANRGGELFRDVLWSFYIGKYSFFQSKYINSVV